MEYTFKAIRDRIKTAFENPVNRLEGSFSMDNAQAVAQELARIYQMEIIPIPDQVSLDTATGENLDRKGLDFQEPRKAGEEDETYRKRILEKIRNPITTGNENYYVYLAKQVNGVGNAKCVGCWAGPGTVKVIILSSSAGEPSEQVLQQVREHIGKNRIIGANITVSGAVPLPVSINVTLSLATAYRSDEVQVAIMSTLSDYLTGIAYTGNQNLSYHRIGELMFGVSGVDDIADYTVNGARESLQIQIDQFFQLEGVTVHVPE